MNTEEYQNLLSKLYTFIKKENITSAFSRLILFGVLINYRDIGSETFSIYYNKLIEENLNRSAEYVEKLANFLDIPFNIKTDTSMNHLVEKIKKDNGFEAIDASIKEYIRIARENRKPLVDPKNIILTGGAIVDILEDRKPKDYDLFYKREGGQDLMNVFHETGWTFVSGTKTAITFKKDDLVVQILTNGPDYFCYTIEQGKINFSISNPNFYIDKVSFDTKILIPTNYSFNHKAVAVNALARIYHWYNKGYVLPEKSYLSLLKRATRSVSTGNNNSYSYSEFETES